MRVTSVIAQTTARRQGMHDASAYFAELQVQNLLRQRLEEYLCALRSFIGEPIGVNVPDLNIVDHAEQRRRERARAWVASGFRTLEALAAETSEGSDEEVLELGGLGSEDLEGRWEPDLNQIDFSFF